jgi:hypothetical protein
VRNAELKNKKDPKSFYREGAKIARTATAIQGIAFLATLAPSRFKQLI